MSWKGRKKVTLVQVEKTESTQARLTSYNVHVGRKLLYLLPIFLVVLTAVSLLNIFDVLLLLYAFVGVLILFAFNTMLLGLAALKTKSAFTKRLEFERQNGRPIESLSGFVAIRNSIGGTIFVLKLLFMISIVVLAIYAVYIVIVLAALPEDLAAWIATLGLGLALVCFGGALLVKSVRMDITSVTGLADFYRPSNHEVLLDNFFGDTFKEHLDPIVRLKWDEFTEEIRKCLKPEFVDEIKKEEPDESPVKFALEKLLYMHYLEYSGVLPHEEVVREISEIIDMKPDTYHPDRGAKIGTRSYFNSKDISQIFDLIEDYSPSFFDLVDRLQLELVDNITVLADERLYFDCAVQEVCSQEDECNIFLLLYNNSPEPKAYTVRIVAPGCQPCEMEVEVMVEGRGSFEIPKKTIPLTSEKEMDVAYVLSTMIKNGDAAWITLEPRELGTQTVQVFVKDDKGNVVRGKTMAVTIVRKTSELIKKIVSLGSVLSGALSPVLKGILFA